jgi:hypothetical protein
VRLRPDDDVYRINAVWLGPRGLTLPWVARYSAYAVWLVVFLLILAVEGITPLRVGVPPVWELAISILITYAVMGFVDHDRPVRSLFELGWSELTSPRKAVAVERGRVQLSGLRVNTRRGSTRRGNTRRDNTRRSRGRT